MGDLGLNNIALILGCKKPTASLLKRGLYHTVAKDTALPERYQRLADVVGQAQPFDPSALCHTCPRQDCTGCRVAEII